MISFDAVSNNIPLLISKKSLKSLGLKLISWMIQLVLMESVSPWTMEDLDADDISPRILQDLNADYTNVMQLMKHIGELSRSEKMTKTQKLHKQFTHTLKKELIKLVKESKDFEVQEKWIGKCYDTCQICRKYKQRFPDQLLKCP